MTTFKACPSSAPWRSCVCARSGGNAARCWLVLLAQRSDCFGTRKPTLLLRLCQGKSLTAHPPSLGVCCLQVDLLNWDDGKLAKSQTALATPVVAMPAAFNGMTEM